MTVFRAVLSGTFYGQTTQNVLFFEKENAAWPADGELLSTLLRDNWIGGAAGIRDRVSSNHLWHEVRVYNTASPGDVPVILPMSLTGLRTNLPGNISPQSTFIMRLRGATGGRRGRGRSYVPAPPPEAFTAGIMTSGYVTAWQAVLDSLTTKFLPPTNSLGFLLKIRNNTPDADSYTTVVRLEMSNKYGTQRRRNIGVGV